MKAFFELHEITSLETPRYRLTLTKNGGDLPVQVSVTAESLPGEFVREVVTVKADLDALRCALERGR